MSDWFMVSMWLENQEQDVHFEVANEDGEQYFFSLNGTMLSEAISLEAGSLQDKMYYVEEDLLALGVAMIDVECLEPEDEYRIKSYQFKKHFPH